MPYWMVGEHGTHACYDLSDMKTHLGMGWKLLNQGESPDYSSLKKPAAPTEAVVTEPQPDILDGVVVNILPQLVGMDRAALELLRSRESQGKNRKGLLAAIDGELEGK